MDVEPLRLALDENFPEPLLNVLRDSSWLPRDVEITHINRLDPRLRGMGDRQLLIALYQLGFHGLITNNWRMLNIPMEIAAIVATNAVVVAIKDMGDDAIRATGALLLELPGIRKRLKPGVSNVFLLNYARRHGEDAWESLRRAAEHEGVSVGALYDQVKLSPDELTRPVLD